ncbi:hypothetical protein EIP91_007348 [Steccherinum ochraceum]|uniref:Uncharacterized protein n=1 Tax=Steccherinum ochraceum TaxID=92696 RepID=A0A4R0RS00_9APHY|nr:hypothetical protein EIP91_007348 [Steccherinum ochraceum]
MRFTTTVVAFVALASTAAFAAPLAVTNTPAGTDDIHARDDASNLSTREFRLPRPPQSHGNVAGQPAPNHPAGRTASGTAAGGSVPAPQNLPAEGTPQPYTGPHKAWPYTNVGTSDGTAP